MVKINKIYTRTGDDGTTGLTTLHAALNSEEITGGNVDHLVYEQPNGSSHNVFVDGPRVTNGFILKDISCQVLQYSI